MRKVYINKAECFSSIGFGQQYNWKAIQAQKSGIKKIDQLGFISACYGGQIDDAWIDEQLQHSIEGNSSFTRFERLLISTLHPLVDQGKITAKTALVVSTTKGNIAALATGNLEEADMNRSVQRIADFFGFTTPAVVVCNACVSGILAVSVAKRLIQMEQFDEAYVVAGDELTAFVVSGFNSFQAMSKEPCTPFDLNRKGVSLGEAAAAVYLSTKSVEGTSFEVVGEASIADANHISGPSRTGEGLFLSIQEALQEAQLTTAQIDCICAHGTATAYNDEMEAIAFDRLGLAQTPIHSQKGYFGHTLGAAGLLELVMLMQSMRHNELIVSKGFTKLGVSRELNITTATEVKSLQIGLKTASGFGGSNTALILSKK
ncbi:beta-ketoacyl synthase [Myroides sp. NP-2]|uniref:beta-ketoacyl-[acyl-carrier-protein] synthase family protein n=1 Tax=Myroides sp. NP-2 TaxID=2759945 RepID=UPI0015F9DB4C|nr:beta-ketoacyl synthase N-terminal-like domain-containing protein [Myroides sp. NP-2]MBB1149254.1 beta-ketoacyl synthase [Myroides sp. NP-2]